jgi:hypothetical protein
MRGRIILTALLAAAGLVASPEGAAAQSSEYFKPPVDDAPPAGAASPYGARYIPGVGFRYIYPGGPRVYGYTSYYGQTYGYAPRRRGCGAYRVWNGERCVSRAHRRIW